MNRSRATVTLATLLALAAGCGSNRATQDPATEEKAIWTRIGEFDRAVAARDINAISRLYAEDAVMVEPREPPFRGREAIHARYEWLLGDPCCYFTMETTEVSVAASGDLAYEAGTLAAVLNEPEGVRRIPHRYLSIWRKIDGVWYITRDYSLVSEERAVSR